MKAFMDWNVINTFLGYIDVLCMFIAIQRQTPHSEDKISNYSKTLLHKWRHGYIQKCINNIIW